MQPNTAFCNQQNYDITVAVLDIIHRPVLYFKHNVSETGLCFRIQAELTQLGLNCCVLNKIQDNG
jgi:hypothetical protein